MQSQHFSEEEKNKMLNFLKKERSDLGTVAEAYSKDAIDDAKSFNGVLDYSNESIEVVEGILDIYEKGIKKEKPSVEQLEKVVKMYGCYAGEALIKNLGLGEWEIPKSGPVEGAWTVNVNEKFYLFPAKTNKRIMNGREDNIVSMYNSAFNENSKKKISLRVFNNPHYSS